MAYLNVKNNAASKLAAAISDSASSLTVLAGEGARFPSSNFHITIDDEILLCSSRTNDVLTITRAKESTNAAAHAKDAPVRLNITAAIIDQLQAHEALTTDVHGVGALGFKLSSNLISVGHDVSVTGDQEVTGVGFQPTALVAFAAKYGVPEQCHGFSDPDRSAYCVCHYNNATSEYASYLILYAYNAANSCQAAVKSYDADGFTLTWTKTGSPTGTYAGFALCLK